MVMRIPQSINDLVLVNFYPSAWLVGKRNHHFFPQKCISVVKFSECMMSHVAIPATGFNICVKDVYHDGVIDNLMDKNYSLFLAGLLSEDQYFE